MRIGIPGDPDVPDRAVTDMMARAVQRVIAMGSYGSRRIFEPSSKDMLL